jgi:hypothetical protein
MGKILKRAASRHEATLVRVHYTSRGMERAENTDYRL